MPPWARNGDLADVAQRVEREGVDLILSRGRGFEPRHQHLFNWFSISIYP